MLGTGVAGKAETGTDVKVEKANQFFEDSQLELALAPAQNEFLVCFGVKGVTNPSYISCS